MLLYYFDINLTYIGLTKAGHAGRGITARGQLAN